MSDLVKKGGIITGVVAGVGLVSYVLYKGVNSVYKNYCCDTVNEPALGVVVYCDLLTLAEHSGVYIGNGELIHLDGDGVIEKVSAPKFVARLNRRNPASTIYTTCKETVAVGHWKTSDYAISQLGKKLDYSVVKNNCHRFTLSCLTNRNVDELVLHKSKLMAVAKELCGADTWRVWQY